MLKLKTSDVVLYLLVSALYTWTNLKHNIRRLTLHLLHPSLSKTFLTDFRELCVYYIMYVTIFPQKASKVLHHSFFIDHNFWTDSTVNVLSSSLFSIFTSSIFFISYLLINCFPIYTFWKNDDIYYNYYSISHMLDNSYTHVLDHIYYNLSYLIFYLAYPSNDHLMNCYSTDFDLTRSFFIICSDLDPYYQFQFCLLLHARPWLFHWMRLMFIY